MQVGQARRHASDWHEKRVMLANAPNPEPDSVGRPGNYAMFPAMGVVYLATRLRREYPDLNIKVADGGISGFNEVKKEIDTFKPDLLGLSVLTTTYGEGLKLAEYAKGRYGTTIVMGNDHASFFPEAILRNRPYVDYTIKAEVGEEPISYVVGKELYGRPDDPTPRGGEEAVYSRTDSGIIQTNFPKVKLSNVYAEEDDIPDLNFIPGALRAAKENYNIKYGKYHRSERIPCVINNVRGCGNGEIRCTYCSIYDLSLNIGSPKFFWKTVDKLNEEHGVNFFFEVCDSFLTFQKYIKTLIQEMPFNPKDRDIEFEVYARANDVVNVKDSVRWLQKMNVTRVNLGIDSGDDNMLRLLRKNNVDRRRARHLLNWRLRHVLSPSEINYRAVKMITGTGLATLHVSFPLGALGETHKSLDNTVKFVNMLSEAAGYRIATIEASELIPLPNSPSWDILLSSDTQTFAFAGGMEKTLADAGINLSVAAREELRCKYGSTDLLEYDKLARDWIKYFTHITWSDLEWAKESISKIASRIGAAYGNAI